MLHRDRIHRANQMRWQEIEQKSNKAMFKVLGYTILFALIIVAIVLRRPEKCVVMIVARMTDVVNIAKIQLPDVTNLNA